MVLYPNDELIRMWEADKGNKPTDDISDLHKWAAARIAELESQNNEFAIGLQKALDDLKYIKGIVERGAGETIQDDQPIATAIREYVKTLEAELSEYQQTASLMYTADQKAIAKWRKGHQERALIIPDRRDMVVWLLEQLTAAQKRERWIPISDGPPKNIRPVLVRARDKRGECFVLRASYAHKRELEIDSDDYADGFADHDEDNGIDYCPEGWYEWNYTDEVHYYLGHLEITYWRELPAPPAEKE